MATGNSKKVPLMVKTCLAVVAMVVTVMPAASEAGRNKRKDRVAAVTGEVFSSCEAAGVLRVLCDEIGGRVSGTPRGREARDYVERLLNSYGLSNVHQEEFEIYGWENVSVSCMANEPVEFRLHPVPLANTPSTPAGGLVAEVIDVGHGNPVELGRLGDEVRGKIALAVAGAMPGGKWMHRSEVMAAVAEAGAAGLLYQTTRDGHLPMTGMCWKDGIAPIPGLGIAREDGAWIRRQIANRGRVVLTIEMTNLTGPSSSANVIGEIPGRGNEKVIVAAHLDSWDLGQGAVDNGTGTVVVLEAARALVASGIQPEATVRFLLTMGEEMGLTGAEAYVDAHRGEMPMCRAMINCDMEGVPVGIRLMGREDATPWFEDLIGELGGFDLPSGLIHRVSMFGDQQPFLLAGVPVLAPASRIAGDAAKYYHTWADTYDKVEHGQLTQCAAFVGILALELAITPERVMPHKSVEEVEEMMEKHGLVERLEVWGKWPLH